MKIILCFLNDSYFQEPKNTRERSLPKSSVQRGQGTSYRRAHQNPTEEYQEFEFRSDRLLRAFNKPRLVLPTASCSCPCLHPVFHSLVSSRSVSALLGLGAARFALFLLENSRPQRITTPGARARQNLAWSRALAVLLHTYLQHCVHFSRLVVVRVIPRQ